MSRSRTDRTVFLVNPASANGATGRRWPALANRAAHLGLTGETLFSERPGHLIALAREAVDGGATLVVAVGGDGTLNEVVNGVAGRDVDLATIPIGTGMDFVRTYAIPTPVRRGGARGGRRRCAHDRRGPGALPDVGGRGGGALLRERRLGRHERRGRPAGQRDVEGSRREGNVLLCAHARLPRLGEHRGDRAPRRRRAAWTHARRRRRERGLARRRDEARPRRTARRRAVRRRADRRRQQGRLPDDRAEDLQGQARPPREGRSRPLEPRRCRCAGARCRSRSRASRSGRRRRRSRSSRARFACACRVRP